MLAKDKNNGEQKYLKKRPIQNFNKIFTEGRGEEEKTEKMC